MKLTNGNIYDIYLFLTHPIVINSCFGQWATFDNIDNKATLKPLYEIIEEKRKVLQKDSMQGTPEFEEYQNAFIELRKEEQEVTLKKYPREQLRLDENKIPSGFIEIIQPFLLE